MKDMSAMSGTKSQALPTSSPLNFRQSVLESDDHVAFIGWGGGYREESVNDDLNKVNLSLS